MKTKLMVAAVALAFSVQVMAQVNTSRSAERGNDSTTSSKQSSDQRSSRGASRTMSVNAILLDTYIEKLEQQLQFPNYDKSRRPDGIFNNLNEAAIGLATATAYESKILSNPEPGFPASNGNVRMTIKQAREQFNGAASTFSPSINYKDPAVERYLLAVAFAHFVLSDAAQSLEQNGITGSPQVAVNDAINAINIFDAAMRAHRLVASVTYCSGAYPRMDVSGGVAGDLALRCGPISIDLASHRIDINGRPTLSQDAINGRRIEVAMNDENSRSTNNEKSTSKYSKTSSGTQKTYQTAGASK